MGVALQEAHRTRSIRPLELWTIGAWRPKTYGIAYDAAAPREALSACGR